MTLRFDPYSVLVDFYDRWSAHMVEDVPFYVRRSLEARDPVVELGVGTGRVAIPIAQAGRRVIGVDASLAMLTEGERRAAGAGVADRITFVHDDMRTYVAEPPVELVTIPFRSFLHLLTVEDQLAALGAIHRSLDLGGRLICNFFLPDPAVMVAQDGQRNLHSEYLDERGRRCEVSSIPTNDLSRQLLRLRAVVDVYEGERLADTVETELELRLVYRFEMEHLLARAGFEVEALYGGFDESPLEGDAREMIWVARKL